MNHAPSYADQQRDPRKHLIGISTVVVFHLLLVYALLNGLGRKVVEVLKAPLDVSIIEEIKTPPPPPPKIVKLQPKVSAPPPPAYVPKTETQVQAPTPPITTTAERHPEPPPAPPAPAPEPAKPAQVNIAVACPNHQSVPVDVPKQAIRMGLSGQVLAEFTVAANGDVKDIAIVQTSNSIFNQAAINAISRYRCTGQGREVRVRVPFVFRNE
ncbi:energy transducer TonB [Azonexus sp. IMCC34842]|uniref:energy transducer TonB n=1 Tax=Azonexaceae TaxID=2008795 RepID=UPI001CF80536|nr:energy transducer TonB [Dechloromonas denitrificans]UCV05593.1 TonB family protein [Dechloromonas denitrificans]